MFDGHGPRLFAVPAGVDFPAELVAGLKARLAGEPPEAMARVEIFLNTARMRRRVVEIFATTGAGFLPRLRLITDVANLPLLGLPPAIPPLRRRLELAQLIDALLKREPKLAPPAALYDLADSLARLMDELQGEGLSPGEIAQLDVSNHAAHWSRTRAFLSIIGRFFEDSSQPDAEARQRLAVDQLARDWQSNPPDHPVLIAGSTGSRGTTLRFMEAVASLPQGAIVLPGFDFDMPRPVWAEMDDVLTAEDHPQYRFRRLMDRLGLNADAIARWTDRAPPAPNRNRLLSLALRPAPVTDQWLVEGPNLPDLLDATQDVSLVEATSPRVEALAIALILRNAAETGTNAALITPDRNLSRQVTAALDRWGILPDDSAGRPLALSPPGRYLRQISALFGEKLTADRLLALLKHPLTSSGGDRGPHLRFTRDLELDLRRKGPAFPDAASLALWASLQKDPATIPWADAIGQAIDGLEAVPTRPLLEHVRHHRSVAEALARGTGAEGAGGLWDKEAGIEALKQISTLEAEAPYGGSFTAAAYDDLFSSIFAKGEVREPLQSHPRIMIWGTLEARVQGADLVVLGGLNDGVWPGLPDPDPWLNRRMRKEVGLLLPERQIGLSAHDFQQAMAAPRVVITRSTRDAEAETVPSRWLNRLFNLMDGLPARNGKAALLAMRRRGQRWLQLAAALEVPPETMRSDPNLQPALRPAPQPPVSARPKSLSLTRIQTLIRDPYAIYAQRILRLKPLDPLRAAPDPRERGNVFHKVLERFVRERPADETRAQARERLLSIADEVLAEQTPYPAARLLWHARLARVAEHFLTEDAKHGGTALVLETKGKLQIDPPGFTLEGIPDRIDRLPDGRLHLIDYKTGTPPTKDMQNHFDKQLRLASVMAEKGAFEGLGPSDVASFSYIGLGSGQKVEESRREEVDLETEWKRFLILITRYAQRETGYVSRRAVFETRIAGDYDHLARFGEWEMTDRAAPQPVGPKEAE